MTSLRRLYVPQIARGFPLIQLPKKLCDQARWRNRASHWFPLIQLPKKLCDANNQLVKVPRKKFPLIQLPKKLCDAIGLTPLGFKLSNQLFPLIQLPKKLCDSIYDRLVSKSL